MLTYVSEGALSSELIHLFINSNEDEHIWVQMEGLGTNSTGIDSHFSQISYQELSRIYVGIKSQKSTIIQQKKHSSLIENGSEAPTN